MKKIGIFVLILLIKASLFHAAGTVVTTVNSSPTITPTPSGVVSPTLTWTITPSVTITPTPTLINTPFSISCGFMGMFQCTVTPAPTPTPIPIGHIEFFKEVYN